MDERDDNPISQDAPPAPVDFALLRECLRFTTSPDRLRDLRIRLLSDRETWEKIYDASEPTRLGPALHDRLSAQALIPPSAAKTTDGLLLPGQVMGSIDAVNHARRGDLARGLRSVVTILNKAGIVPLLLKGSRALWLDRSHWRQMRDLDLLVPEPEFAKAQTALAENGFASDPDVAERPHRHHAPPLFHDDIPAATELHRRAGNRYAEQFFPTPEIWPLSIAVERDGLQVRILGDGDDVWHNLVHHYFGHSGFARGLVDLKGLFEFAAACSALNEAEFDVLRANALRCACGLAALDLWLAAASDGLGLEIPKSLTLEDDAMAAWERMRARQDGVIQSAVRYPGYRETLQLALSKSRVDAVSAHRNRAPFQVRLAAINKLLPKVSRSGRW